MRRVPLGRTGLSVSRIAFGTWQLGGEWGAVDESSAIAAIRHAHDREITLFDTAQGYGFGASESILARALAGLPREDVVIATKGGLRSLGGGRIARDASPEAIKRGVDDSLRALQTDYIDIFQVHWPDPNTPLSATAEALAALVTAGKIRHVGVSNYNVKQMEDFGGTRAVETLQPPYHLFHRHIEAEILPYTRAHDVGVLVYGPLAHGLLSGGLRADTRLATDDWRSKSADFQGEVFRRNLHVAHDLERLARETLGVPLSRLAVAWTLANPAVHVAIVGTRNQDHVDDAVSAADLDLDGDVLRRIDEITRDAVPIAGPTPEGM